jgi:hypothetical protein
MNPFTMSTDRDALLIRPNGRLVFYPEQFASPTISRFEMVFNVPSYQLSVFQ